MVNIVVLIHALTDRGSLRMVLVLIVHHMNELKVKMGSYVAQMNVPIYKRF